MVIFKSLLKLLLPFFNEYIIYKNILLIFFYNNSYFWKATMISTMFIVIIGTYSIWIKWLSSFIRYLQRRNAMKKIQATQANNNKAQ